MTASRIGNVTAALRAGRAAAGGVERDVGALCRALFEEVIEVGYSRPGTGTGRHVSAESAPADRLSRLAASLAAAAGERVLVVEAGDAHSITAEALLALVAWPERRALQLVDAQGEDLPCAIFRRQECLARIRALEEGGGPVDRGSLEAALGIERVSLAALGIAAGGAGGGLEGGLREAPHGGQGA